MRPVNIIKIIHADKVGFDLHQIPYPTTIGVHVATETEPPYVLVRGYGDFRPASIVVTGDVTIMNGDGVVLSQESYERLTAKAKCISDLNPDDYAGPRIIETPTAIETRYTEPNSGIKFVPSPGYDAMDELIRRGHAHIFAQMFTWLADTQPNGTWYLYLNDLARDKDEVVGIMEACGQPHIIVLKDRIRPVDALTATEKECYGLRYTPDTGWKVKDYDGRKIFAIGLINGKTWNIEVPKNVLNFTSR